MTVVDTESAACPIGCIDGDDFVLEGRDLLQGLPGKFKVVRCRSCGLMRTNPRPTAVAMAKYYPDDYGPYVGTRERPTKQVGAAAVLRRFAGSAAQALPELEPGRALEIGCASGSFLIQLRDEGWYAEGVEFSESAAAASRALGFRVHAGALEGAPDPSEPFDLCVGWMVLEHLHEPVAALRKLWRWTRPGGWLVLSVPNAAALEFSIFAENWYMLHLPNHLYHFEPPTLTRLLSAGGWRVSDVVHQRSISSLIGSIGFRLKESGRLNRLAAKLIAFPESPGRIHRVLLPLSWIMAAFGQTGRMTIWARREETPNWVS